MGAVDGGSVNAFLAAALTRVMRVTSRASVAQLVRARDCQSLGRRFDSV